MSFLSASKRSAWFQYAVCSLLVLLLAVHTASAQNPTSPVTAQPEATSPTSTLPLGGLRSDSPAYRSLDANLYMQTSAEYRAACYQAYQLATLRLEQQLQVASDDPRPPAVIMDLDETVFDNRGFQSWMLQQSVAYDQAWFDRWEQLGGDQVTLIPGAKQFILAARERGVTIVFISNRNERFRSITKNTLQRLGIGIASESELKLSSTTSDKTARRAEVTQQDNRRVLLNIGDNLRDFDERFRFAPIPTDATVAQRQRLIEDRQKLVDETQASFGTQWIILPNPAYGEWTKPFGQNVQDTRLLTAPGQPIGVAFWNIENLFDLQDDPQVQGDEEFTPEGPVRWTKERLEIKLNNLATVLSMMFDRQGPDVIGLAEVENRAVLELLIEKLQPLGRDYRIVHRDSPSERGIDCALLYDAKRFHLEDAKFHLVAAENTRDIVEATLSRAGRSVTFFVNHWPSRAHDASFRAIAASVLRTRIQTLTQADPFADLLIMGDLNDHPNDSSLTYTLGAVGKVQELQPDKLFNSSWTESPAAGTGTYVFDDKWEILDHIILSPGLLMPGDVSWVTGSTKPVVLATDQLFDPPGPAPPRPSRSYTKETFHRNGYSDHLPVITTLHWQDTPSNQRPKE